MTIRAIILDIGGVLTINPDLGVIARWEELLGLKPGEMSEKMEDIWAGGSIGSMGLAKVHRKTGQALRMTPEQVDAFMADVWHEYLGEPNTELMEYFRSLRPRYHTAIISNSFVGAREKEQERYQLDDLCDFIIYSHEVGIAKPNPRIYALACERLDVKPSGVIFVDDYQPNIDAARKVGMKAVLFKDTPQAIAKIEALLNDSDQIVK